MELAKYSIGVGDRFGHQAKAQLAAIQEAQKAGVQVVPVWNKSNREHVIIGTCPADVRKEVTEAVKAVNYTGEYHIDADHINIKNVDWFMDSSDFFTLDVADFIGQPSPDAEINAFLAKHQDLIGKELPIAGLSAPLTVSQEMARNATAKVLFAIKEAGKLYRHIEAAKGGADNIIVEVSMDETELPQQPVDMLFILAAISDEGIPAQTVAPKFSGRFNKGIDYVGDLDQFEREFNDDLAIIAFAVSKFSLRKNLKLSVHTGSDKFSLYPRINKAIKRFNAGLHLKTAGTTWLEEIIGLAEADGEALQLAKEIYSIAYERFEELRKPYATVIDIDWQKLPSPAEVNTWNAEKFTSTLRHVQSNPNYNKHFRQMLHVAFKVAAEKGDVFFNALEKYESVIAQNVKTNILERHLKPTFF